MKSASNTLIGQHPIFPGFELKTLVSMLLRRNWRVARAFDLAGITNAVGAPFHRVLGEEPALSNYGPAGPSEMTETKRLACLASGERV